MTVRVVTLPRGADALAFARAAKKLGAGALEVRDDVTEKLDAREVSHVLPLLLAHRGGAGFTNEALELAHWVDTELPLPRRGEGRGEGNGIASHHAPSPLSPEQAEALWSTTTAPFIKHVEPLGPPASGARLLETQQRLIARFGAGHVTVLATGDCALPWRAVLAARNAFDYLALDGETASAPGQRLLGDAVRCGVAPHPGPLPYGGEGGRLAIIGHRIAHARSPRAHPQPFDRWDLPPDAPVKELVDALKPHYRGFAVTSPFKRAFGPEAINTLVRRPDGWAAYNTDVEGARAVLTRHGVKRLTALGDGGATWALRKASPRPVTVMTARAAAPLDGDVFWTWPEHVPAPAGLRLDGARVFVIAYGAPATRLCARIVALGGTPVRAGATWFIAQARAQRRLWLEASP